jgi:hypothetical protein
MLQKVVSIEDAMSLKEVREFFRLDQPVRESTSSNEGSVNGAESGYCSSTSSPTMDSPTPGDRIYLGSSERPTSRPGDFEFLKVRVHVHRKTRSTFFFFFFHFMAT